MYNELYHFNKNHDRLGRFASGHGGSSNGKSKETRRAQRKLNSLDRQRAQAQRWSNDYSRQSARKGEVRGPVSDYIVKSNGAASQRWGKDAEKNERQLKNMITKLEKDGYEVHAKSGYRWVTDNGLNGYVLMEGTRYKVTKKR